VKGEATVNKTYTVIAIMLIAAFAATACGASPAGPPTSAPDGPPYKMMMFDGSYGSQLTLDKVATLTRAAAVNATAASGSIVSFWVLGKALADTRQIYLAEYQEPTSRQKPKILAENKRFIEVTVNSVKGVMEGVLAMRPKTTPLPEGISKMLRARPRGVKVLIIVVTDMLAFGDGLNFEDGPIPTDTAFAKWCAVRGLLAPRSATDVSIVFSGVDLSPSDDGATGTSMARQTRIEQLWITALKNAGASDVTVIAGWIDFKRGARTSETRTEQFWTVPVNETAGAADTNVIACWLGFKQVARPRRRRKDSIFRRLLGLQGGGINESEHPFAGIDGLREPKLGISLHQYIVSEIGSRPVHAPDRNPRHQRAVRDAMIGPEVDAQQRVVDALAQRRAEWSPSWLHLALIALGAAFEIVLSEQLFFHLGIDRPQSIILAVSLALLLVALLSIFTRAKNKAIAWVTCAVFLLILGAIAVLRTGEVSSNEDSTILEPIAMTVVFLFIAAASAVFIEIVLINHIAAARVGREMHVEENKLNELKSRMEAGRGFDEQSYDAVVRYDKRYRETGAKALAMFPDHFKETSVPSPSQGSATGNVEDTDDAN